MKGHLINIRWVDIPEDRIFNNLSKLKISTWKAVSLPVAGSLRYYLFGNEYAYPYSLPVVAIERLANRLNRSAMFNFQEWIEVFRAHKERYGEIYNDADSYGVKVEHDANLKWQVLGIHHLLPDENRGNHNVFVELLCKQDEREAFRPIHWTWRDRRPSEPAPDIFAGQKPLDELVDLPLNLGMVVSVWPHLGETASNFSSAHPDEGEGNSYGHHSFFVCFQEVETENNEPEPPPPPPVPEPEPEPEPNEKFFLETEVRIVNEDGSIKFTKQYREEIT